MTTMRRLSLTSAELALLLVSLPADPRPFIESSDLVGVDSTVLYRRMEAARSGLLSRKLATVRDDNSLEVAEPVRAILTALHQPAAGFQLMHAWAGMPAERAFFSITPGMIVFDRVADRHWHHLEVLTEPHQIAERAASLGQLDSLEPGAGEERAFALPGDIFAPLAEIPPKPDAELLARLAAAGLSETEARAFLEAGVRPLHQTVFYSLRGRETTVTSQATVWFGNRDSSWLLDNATPETVRLRRATPATTQEAIQAVIAEAVAG